MSTLLVEWGPRVAPDLRALLTPILDAVERKLKRLDEIAVVVGAPSASGWGRVHDTEHLVAVSAGAEATDPFWCAAVARAAAVIDADGSAAKAESHLPLIPLPAVAPPALHPAWDGLGADNGDRLAARVVDLWHGMYPGIQPPRVHVPIRLIGCATPLSGMRTAAAWAGGAVPVLLCLPGHDCPADARPGGALVACGTLEALEAVDALVRSPRLARSLLHRGRAHLSQLADPERAAETIADALVATLEGASR